MSALIVWGLIAWAGLSHGDSARLFQAVGAVTDIVAGGIFAYYKLQLFRDFEPHLTITHEVSHRFIGDSYVHIAVTANLYNSSRVKIELREGFFLVQQISPISDNDIDELYAQVFETGEHRNIQWPTLDDMPIYWGENELLVEPGESHQEAYESVVSRETQSVVIYTYYYNTGHSANPQNPEGWGATTVYDILDLS